MKIEENQIAEKIIAGKTGKGEPVVMIQTHGGLFAFFAKKDKEITTLGMAPHRGIAAWMSEKKDPSIKWKEGFLKGEVEEGESLQKNEDAMFNRLRNVMFSPVRLVKNETKINTFLYYDIFKLDIGVMHMDAIKDMYKSGELDGLCLVRNLNLNEPPQTLESHKDFN